MKLSELKPCAVCGGKLPPIWHVIRTSQAMLKPAATNQVLGLMQMFHGNLALAEAMASETDCVLIMGDKDPKLLREINVCNVCFMVKELSLPYLLEMEGKTRD